MCCRAPDGLYENGLQRDLFLPFIARLKKQTVVHNISSATDYRRLAQHSNGFYYTPQEFADPDAEAVAHFEALAAACHKDIRPADVEVMMGRHLPVPAACMFLCPLPLTCTRVLQSNVSEALFRCPFRATLTGHSCRVLHNLPLSAPATAPVVT